LHAADSISALIKMSVTAQDSGRALPANFEDRFVEQFRTHFNVPKHLPLAVVMGWPPCDSLGSRCAHAVLHVGAIAYATAHDDGKLSDIQVVDAALTPSFADSVTSALVAMSKAAAAPPTGNSDEIPIVIELAREDAPDSVPALRQVLVAKVPRYDIPFRYALMPAAGVEAQFPFTARLAGVGDSVTVAFTVDGAGYVAPESLELVRATYSDFVVSVLKALGTTRYHPAYLGDCPVATRMKQRFVFRLPD
jgi:hypothetical protein